MRTVGIHRVVEQQVASHPAAVALIDGDRSLTYSELNRRANLVARYFMDQGFRRGSQAVVNVERSLEQAVVLLAVLKAGGAYTCADVTDRSWPAGVSILEEEGRTEQRWHAMDVRRLASEPAPPSPNLPIVTRAGDVACVLRGTHGLPAVLVPHDTVTALIEPAAPPMSAWTGEEPAAVDLWLALMAGATAIVSAAPATAAAA
jgi:non-ribosomal peptide synthetase component F